MRLVWMEMNAEQQLILKEVGFFLCEVGYIGVRVDVILFMIHHMHTVMRTV